MTFPLLTIIVGDDILPLTVAVIITSLIGAAIVVFKETGFNNLTRAKKVVTIIGSVIALAGIVLITIAYTPGRI